MTKTVAESILQGMKEALAHARGEIELPERIVFRPEKYKKRYVPEAELEQRPPPKRKVEGSNPSGDSNSDNL